MARWLGAIDPMSVKLEAATPNGRPVFYSVQEQWESWVQALAGLENRHVLVKLAGKPAVQIRTLNLPPMLKVVKEAEGWDIEGLSKALGAEGRPHQDVIWGDGHRFFLHEIPAELELYPERMVVRYHSPAVYLAMSDVSIENDAASVRLTAEDSKSRTVVSLFKAEGVISLAQPIPEDAVSPAVAEDARIAAESHNKPEGKENNNNTTEHRESPDRVTNTGNVGRDPELRTTAKGRKILKFPLGVHEGEKTTWRDVLSFDEKAERVAGQLSKGELVTVVGYKHEREAEVKKGNQSFKKNVIEIYGALLQTPKDSGKKASK